MQTVRGLLLSLVLLVLLVLMVAGLAGQCSLQPGGPDTRGAVVPTVDAEAELRRLARAVAFPVRVPQVPSQWRATSADVDRVGRAPDSPAAVRVGWLPSEGTYLRLSQSSAAQADLVSFDTGTPSTATGVVRVQDENWAVYPGPHGEQVWVADLGVVRILITGSAGEPEFRTLATATLTAPRALG